jgi:hypothetical protein
MSDMLAHACTTWVNNKDKDYGGTSAFMTSLGIIHLLNFIWIFLIPHIACYSLPTMFLMLNLMLNL